jgi:peptidoglycan hydrolase-like protein with peptidoglycan-binding domain
MPKPPITRFEVDKIASLPTLSLGTTHPDLIQVKRYLSSFGYTPPANSTTPNFDNSIRNALKRFQRQMGLSPTGSLTPETKQLMSSFRCALPDVDPLGAITVGPWTRRNLTYAFAHLTTQIPAPQTQVAVRNAFATWQNAGVDITLTEVAVEAGPDISVEWRPANDPDHSMVGSLVAHADFPPGFSMIVNGLPLPLHFDDEEHGWTVTSVAGAFDIQSIALHEIGHCLGLVHSSDPSSIMYPTVQPNLIQRVLQLDDLQKLRTLYP